MSSNEFVGLISRIDASIEDSELRIQREVEQYIAKNAEAIAQEIGLKGSASIPTFAGEIRITEDELRQIVGAGAAAA